MEKAFYLLARYEITNICVYEGSKYCGYYGGLSCKFLILPTLLFKLNKHFWCLHVYYSCNMLYNLRSYFLNIFLYTQSNVLNHGSYCILHHILLKPLFGTFRHIKAQIIPFFLKYKRIYIFKERLIRCNVNFCFSWYSFFIRVH